MSEFSCQWQLLACIYHLWRIASQECSLRTVRSLGDLITISTQRCQCHLNYFYTKGLPPLGFLMHNVSYAVCILSNTSARTWYAQNYAKVYHPWDILVSQRDCLPLHAMCLMEGLNIIYSHTWLLITVRDISQNKVSCLELVPVEMAKISFFDAFYL